MTELQNDFNPDWISPPGDTIQDLMEERDWSQSELARRLGFSAKHLNQLIKGKVSLTRDTALRLECVLGSTANFWMNRELRYQQRLARQDALTRYKGWTSWLDKLPLDDLKKANVIPNERISATKKPQLVETLLGFFKIASPDEWENYYGGMQGSFRRTRTDQSDLGAITTWLRLGEIEAEKLETPKYNKRKFESALKTIRELTVLPQAEFQPVLKDLCAEAGVKWVYVPKIRKAHVSGVARWLNGHSPLIQMSLYGKQNDKFWFTFFHEAAHILLHADKDAIFLDDKLEIDTSDQEMEANEWAGDKLIPKKFHFELLELREEDQIIDFARNANVHPGVVVGRLQYERIIGHANPLNHLKENLEIAV